MIILLMGLAIILLTMVLLGWLAFAKSENEAAIRLKTWKIKQDWRTAMEKVRKFVAQVRHRLRRRRHRSEQSERPLEASAQGSARGDSRGFHEP